MGLTFTLQKRGQLDVNPGTLYLNGILEIRRISVSLPEGSPPLHAGNPQPPPPFCPLNSSLSSDENATCSPELILEPCLFQCPCVCTKRSVWKVVQKGDGIKMYSLPVTKQSQGSKAQHSEYSK